ncbi:MAG: CoA transferase, partial [Gammaproteobacteria bacterium]|nr:CoA transferase [Gammaproteobacteria bacterium]
MEIPLAGLRVVELGDGALSGLCGMMLADFGAEVLWLNSTAQSGHYQVWQRGKQCLDVDLETDKNRICELIVDSADVFLAAKPLAELETLGLDYPTLKVLRPNLIMAQLSGFGNDNPYSALPVTEGLAAAKIGRMMTFEGVAARPGPVYPALQVGTHAAAQAACAGVLAAIGDRVASNRGRYLETSLLRGLLPFEMHFLLAE